LINVFVVFVSPATVVPTVRNWGPPFGVLCKITPLFFFSFVIQGSVPSQPGRALAPAVPSRDGKALVKVPGQRPLFFCQIVCCCCFPFPSQTLRFSCVCDRFTFPPLFFNICHKKVWWFFFFSCGSATELQRPMCEFLFFSSPHRDSPPEYSLLRFITTFREATDPRFSPPTTNIHL